MPCVSPLKGFRSRKINPLTGKRSVVFNRHEGFADLPVEFACGQCIACRLERSKQWAIRCVHEASQFEDNCFITLTYDDQHLPADGSLCLDHFQRFMKRLRKKFFGSSPVIVEEKEQYPIRFFHCGEYGTVCKNCKKSEQFCLCDGFVPGLGRPHYHACIFNFRFSDLVHYKTKQNVKLYTSKSLQDLWPFGFSTVGDVTFESAAYVARYITKKITGDKADEHYEGRCKEYTTMSRRPGIGALWFDRFKDDTYRDDYVIMRGKKLRPPRFYDNKFSQENESLFNSIKSRRKYKARLNADDNTSDRLAVKENILNQKFKLLKRSYENDV